MTTDEALRIGRERLLAGRIGEAESICRQVLKIYPAHPDALFLLGAAAQKMGRLSDAIDLLRRAVAGRADHAEAGTLLGNFLYSAGRVEESVAAYRRVLAVCPSHADAHINLGNILKAQGHPLDALNAYLLAISLGPEHPIACNNAGAALNEMGRREEAVEFYRRAIAADPRYFVAHRNLGNALFKLGRQDEAIVSYRRAIELSPSYSPTHESIAKLYLESGRIHEALASFREAVRCDPGSAGPHSSMLVSLHLHPGYDTKAICAEHERFELAHARALRQTNPHYGNGRLPERRLRVGYVSPDFRNHPTSYFSTPLLSAHDPARVEVYCYSDVSKPDAFTQRLRGFARVWRDITGKSDEDAAKIIASDGIDILVDLALHGAGGRPLLFARKPAPVQVSWLGYPATTGLTAMDYRLTDSYIDPPGQNDDCQVEQLIRLPDTSLCYDPMATDLPVGEAPAAGSDGITFGCLNIFCKVNDLVLRLFVRVLKAVEGSTLLLATPRGAPRERVLSVLHADGLDAERVEFIDYQPTWQQFMQLYNRIDISLDTFPWNGHTTSLESLWMGVPVVSLQGETAVSRAGLCYLSNLGLADLVGSTTDEYVKIATRLAGDVPRLSQLRSTLRQTLEASSLMDRRKFAQNVESAYREMWRRWIGNGTVTTS